MGVREAEVQEDEVGGGDPGDGERLQARAGLEDGVSVPLQKLSQEFLGRWVVFDDR